MVTGITTEVINDNSPMLVRGSKESSGNVDNDLMSLSSFNSFDEGDEDWEFKRSKVVEEMKLQLNEMQGLSKNEIDEKVQTIFENQLGISTGESEHFLEDFSDSVTEEIIEKGVDLINTEIREKIRLNKVEGQLENREKQVEKMNLLITKLKIENGNLNAKVRDLEKENKTLDFNHRKAEEQIEVLAQSIGDDEPLAHAVENKDAEIFKMKNENEKLHSQIESLKKRVNFMYENSKANAATNIDANDVQAMSEENIRLKNLMGNHNNDIDKMKIEKRELENLLEKKKNELREKDILLAKYIDEENGAQSRTKELEIKKLKDDLQRVNKENKETVLKAKSFEQKLKFVNAQLDRYKSEEKKKARGASAASANDTKMNSKINKLESEQGRLKEAAKKAQKELAEKKTELHKVNLENKTLNVKLRELEKKLEILGRKAS
jgi:chromosome segregation ATPase